MKHHVEVDGRRYYVQRHKPGCWTFTATGPALRTHAPKLWRMRRHKVSTVSGPVVWMMRRSAPGRFTVIR